jgi:hypothetical protein
MAVVCCALQMMGPQHMHISNAKLHLLTCREYRNGLKAYLATLAWSAVEGRFWLAFGWRYFTTIVEFGSGRWVFLCLSRRTSSKCNDSTVQLAGRMLEYIGV